MIYLWLIILQLHIITYYYQAIYYIIVFKIQSLSTEYQLWQVKTAVIVHLGSLGLRKFKEFILLKQNYNDTK